MSLQESTVWPTHTKGFITTQTNNAKAVLIIYNIMTAIEFRNSEWLPIRDNVTLLCCVFNLNTCQL